MNEPAYHQPNLTRQQMLAAYADGELTELQVREVERWLCENPRAAADLEAQQFCATSNTSLWRSVEPPMPAEQTWREIYERIEKKLRPEAEPARTSRRASRWLRRSLFVAILALPTAAAAAIAITIALPTTAPIAVSSAQDDDDVFSVTQPHDVEIVSLRHEDSTQLVVGKPPLNENVTLASATEVSLDGVRPDWDGMMPHVQMGGTEIPLIMAPLAR